jgi:alkanesulfonate monooxygenase SsuD/methylene tetrahydromethanopterin reductase-like flavin-dependent oxidoreductase (luciferase family)
MDSLGGVRFGLSFPNFGLYAEPGVTLDLAIAAEESGWDGFFVWDHIVVSDGMPVADPWVLLGAIGQATTRVLIGPMVAAMPRHRPWEVARRAVTLDRLTGGRFILGVGIGYWPEVEFGTFGDQTDARARAEMLDEGLTIIQAMWSGELFDFKGEHYSIAENRFAPVPLGKIRVWVAGMLPNLRPLRRAARFDGVFPIRSDEGPMGPSEVALVAGYVKLHRPGDDPFDVVISAPEAADVDAFGEAGATWLISGPKSDEERLEETLGWIRQGPPHPP